MDTKMEVKYNNNGLTQPRKREKTGEKSRGKKQGKNNNKKTESENIKN